MSNTEIRVENTPNPDSKLFKFNRNISDKTATFESSQETSASPLAQKLFGFPWMAGVQIGEDFVSIRKEDWVSWEILEEPLCDLLLEHIDRGEPVLLDLADESEIRDDDTPTVKSIKEILNKEIRPQVALDGGDIIFHKFEDGIVYVHMRGACNGCPSSTATLKGGIETRLRQSLPEVTEVVSV